MDEASDYAKMSIEELQIQSLVNQVAKMAQLHALVLSQRDAQLLKCELEIKALREAINDLRTELKASGNIQPIMLKDEICRTN